MPHARMSLFFMPSSALDFMTRTKLKLARSIYGNAVPDAVINYVWDNRFPVGTRKPNAYTDRAHMIVAEFGAANAGKWIAARHDVQQDLVAEFGSGQARLIQLSVAADTDNTGENARAGFADFHFVERSTACSLTEVQATQGNRDQASRQARQFCFPHVGLLYAASTTFILRQFAF